MTVRVQPAVDEDLPTIVDWPEKPEIAKWPNCSAGQILTAAALKRGGALGAERIFMFSPDRTSTPLSLCRRPPL
jgi:hypothetical protein